MTCWVTGENLGPRRLVFHWFGLDGAELCCFFLVNNSAAAAWDPRGPGHVAGRVR
jgi:hypothetical protein